MHHYCSKSRSANDKVRMTHFFGGGVGNRQTGFGLVEAVIAIGVLAVATVGMLSLVSSLTNMQTLAEIRSEIVNQVFELRTALSDPNVCRANFGGVVLTGGTTSITKTLHPLRDGSTTVLNTAVSLLPPVSSGVRVQAESYKLIRTATSNVFNLQVNFVNASKVGTSSLFRNIAIRVSAPSGTILDCSSAEGEPGMASTCPALGGIYDSATGKCDILSPTCARFNGVFDAAKKTCSILGSSAGNLADCSATEKSGSTRQEMDACGGHSTSLCVNGKWVLIENSRGYCSN